MARKLSRRWTFAVALVAILGFAQCGLAQATGELTGVTADPSDQAIVGANLQAINLQTNTAVHTISNGVGIYRFPTLPPANYRLIATATGFRTQNVSPVVVKVSRSTHIDITFSIGTVSQEVVVSGSAEQILDTDNGYKGQIINSREIENLPLPSRSPLALTALTPGVTAGNGGTTTARQASDGTSITSAYDINGGVRQTLEASTSTS